jgi:hypothetical protein
MPEHPHHIPNTWPPYVFLFSVCGTQITGLAESQVHQASIPPLPETYADP